MEEDVERLMTKGLSGAYEEERGPIIYEYDFDLPPSQQSGLHTLNLQSLNSAS